MKKLVRFILRALLYLGALFIGFCIVGVVVIIALW